jgi:hypothetical protein
MMIFFIIHLWIFFHIFDVRILLPLPLDIFCRNVFSMYNVRISFPVHVAVFCEDTFLEIILPGILLPIRLKTYLLQFSWREHCLIEV